MLPEWTVVGFSGHRKLSDPKVASDSICKVIKQLAAEFGPLAAVSSAASGADTLFIEEVARRNLPYLLILPFSKNRFQQDFNPADLNRILPLIDQATHVDEVVGEDLPEQAFMETGMRTVDRADIMIAVWDGKKAAGLGGTGDVVDYIRATGKPLIIIDPKDGQIAKERTGLRPAKIPPAGWKGKPRETVENHFQELDETALLHAPKSRFLILRIIILQLAASAIGCMAHAFDVHGINGYFLTSIGFVLLGLAFVSSLHHRKKHHEWMKNRIDAEICRSFLATWYLKRTDYSPKISIEGSNQLCRNLGLIRILDKSPQLPLEVVRERYLKERVEFQSKYFLQQSEMALAIYKKLKALAIFSTAAAALLSLLVLFFSLMSLSGPMISVPKFLALLLPLVSAAIYSLLITQDYSRRAGRYGEIAVILEDTARRLKTVQTWNSLARLATETEEMLLQEAVEWHSFRQFAGEPH